MSWLECPRQVTANIQLWRFRHELTNLPRWNHFVMFPSRTKARTKIERSARWSSRKGDEARDWQRKCVKHVTEIRVTFRRCFDTGKCQLWHRRVAIFKNFPFHSLVPIVEKFGQRRRFESRAIGIHGLVVCSLILSLVLHFLKNLTAKMNISFDIVQCVQIYLYIHHRFLNRWSNLTIFIKPCWLFLIKRYFNFY